MSRLDQRRRPLCLFRVAAGPSVGFGHLMRARALARAMRVTPLVSIRGGRAVKRAAIRLGCRVVGDVRRLGPVDVLIVDDPSPAHGRSWIARARAQGVPSASVHDGGRMSDAELTIDGSLFQASKAGRTVRPRHVLKGTRFYIVDARVAAARRRWRPRPRSSPPSVVVALGGGLHVRRVAARLVTAIAEASPDADILVAAGFTAGPRPRLCRGRWLTANGLIAALRRSHAAVVAGGVTLYEACALGVPAVGFAVVREQQKAIRSFGARGAVVDAGGPPASDVAIKRAARGVRRLLADERTRREVTRRARQLVDGRGALRVARSIERLVSRRRVLARRNRIR